jgi:hypothetical protein
MSDDPIFRTMYVPLPADVWAQAAYLTMRPTVVREQASAMLVRVAQMLAELAGDSGNGSPAFDDLPAEKQALVVELVRNVVTRFATPSR